jgi:hypothetical protein
MHRLALLCALVQRCEREQKGDRIKASSQASLAHLCMECVCVCAWVVAVAAAAVVVGGAA